MGQNCVASQCVPALVSCAAHKNSYPAAKDGVYWIGTAGAWQRAYCDMALSAELCTEVAGEHQGRTRGKAAIGYVPQDVARYPDLSGLENLRFWGRMYGLTGRELNERVDATLEVVGLAERSGDRVADYSGGMQRRLNIAAGLLHRPRLLVLDEPTAGVDPQSRNAILGNVEALGGEGVAGLYTTHYM